MDKQRESWQRIRKRGMIHFITLYGIAIASGWIVVELLIRKALGSPYSSVSIPGIIAKALIGGLIAAVVIWSINEGRYRNSR